MAPRVGFDDKVYPVNVLAAIVGSLAREGIPQSKALQGVQLTVGALSSYKTRVSLNQVARVCRNAAKLSSDPQFAFVAGRSFHLSTYGLYGFAILSSRSFRQAVDFALRYHALSAPLIELSFSDERQRAIWCFAPIAHPGFDAEFVRFIIELNLGIIISLHRDLLGPDLVPLEVHFPFGQQREAAVYRKILGCPVLFGQDRARIAFDGAWLNHRFPLGNEVTYQQLVRLCDRLMEQLQLQTGLAGRVRELLLMKHLVTTSASDVARELNMTERTLRRRLRLEQTSLRTLIHELRMNMAAKYLRDTDLTVKEISHALGFSEDAALRHAFRRWIRSTPLAYRARFKNAAARSRAALESN